MTWQLIHLNEMPASPWRNGGGVTRELLAWPLGSGGATADWDWRLSVAEVTASGPFSRFDGVQRWFAVLRGEGVRLNMDGVPITLTGANPPFQFDGAATVSCELLGGATQDFNLMVRKDRVRAQMRRVNGAVALSAPAGVVALYAADSPAELRDAPDGPATELPPHTLAWRTLEQPAKLRVLAAQALWMEITR